MFVGAPRDWAHGYSFGFERCDDAGCESTYGSTLVLGGHEPAARGDGALFLGSFHHRGATGPYQPGAFLRVDQSFAETGWKGWQESHQEHYAEFYGDIGLASMEGGDAVLFWSQVQERIGLFARRFNGAGEVTAVEPGPGPALGISRLRFVPGAGVSAAISFGGSTSARFELYDLAGRRIASRAVEPEVMLADRDASLGQEVTLAGTAALPSGLYFGRLVAGAHAVSEKVIVAR